MSLSEIDVSPDPRPQERSTLKTSVLVPSFRRPDLLENCLRSLDRQTITPDEVLVVWQGDDTPTRQMAEQLSGSLSIPVQPIHLPEPGIVPAENAALDQARGDVILLIDDDAVAEPDWIERHLRHYADPTVGAVGGPAVNYLPDGSRLPIRTVEPIGKVTLLGKMIGNMYDHPDSWRSHPAREVNHLVGYNMSLRRCAFDHFEARLKRYWQMFEADATLQVQARGLRVLFDPAIVVEHHLRPRDSAYAPGRTGDLSVKVGNAAYNGAFVLSKHTRNPLVRGLRRLYLMAVGSTTTPGPLLLPLMIARHGHPLTEWKVLRLSWAGKATGWRAGRAARKNSSEKAG